MLPVFFVKIDEIIEYKILDLTLNRSNTLKLTSYNKNIQFETSALNKITT